MANKYFFTIIIFTLTDFLLGKKIIEFLSLLIPFIVSFFYKKRNTFNYLITFCLIINSTFISRINIFVIIFMLILDCLVENFPKKLGRLCFLFSTTLSNGIIFPFIKVENLLQLLSGTQVLVGSFQAIRIYEKKMKKFRTDLGGIYYKSQIMILFLDFFINKNNNRIFTYYRIFEFILMIILSFGVFYRPDLENMKTIKIHGILMRISYILILLRFVYLSEFFCLFF